jgi:hypothetical protein
VPAAGDYQPTEWKLVAARERLRASALALWRAAAWACFAAVDAGFVPVVMKETPMRLLIFSLLFANAALMCAVDPASAQSPSSYPWCTRGGDRTNYNSCYFTSKQQCMTTTSGIGAFCFENPEYRRSPQARDKAANSRRPRNL